MNKFIKIVAFFLASLPIISFAADNNYEIDAFSTFRSFSGSNTASTKNSLWFDVLFLKNIPESNTNYYQIGIEISPFYKMKNEKSYIQHIQTGLCGGYNIQFLTNTFLVLRLHGGVIHATLESNKDKELLSYLGASVGLSIPLYKQLSAQFHYGLNFNFFSGGPVRSEYMNFGVGLSF